MKSQTYIAITLGPVFETLRAAQKTRELWGASYFLSYVMRKLTERLSAVLPADGKVMLPATDQLNAINLLGAGLYPDRIYLDCGSIKGDAALEIVHRAMEEVVDSVAMAMYSDLKRLDGDFIGREGQYRSPFSETDCRQCLYRYLKLYAAVVPIRGEANLIEEMASVSDSLDLMPRILPVERGTKVATKADFPVDDDNRNPMQRLFYLANWSFLFQDGFNVATPTQYANEVRRYTDAGIVAWRHKLVNLQSQSMPKEKRSFDSLIEVSSRELGFFRPSVYRDIIETEVHSDVKKGILGIDLAEEVIIGRFKEAFENVFKDYHKYVAIVHADGDNVGKIIKAIGRNPDEIGEFSRAMLVYAQTASEEVVRYGGAPIYVGGDDILFLAPVCNRFKDRGGRRETVFDLLHVLDDQFRELVEAPFHQRIETYYHLEGEKKKSRGERAVNREYPTLSYGLSMTYYKYPLAEAKDLSYSLLEHVKQKVSGKNAVNAVLMKHSGQVLPFLIRKGRKNGQNPWDEFRRLVAATNTSGEFLSSFAYKLDDLRQIIRKVARDKDRLRHLLQNNFNENYKSNAKFYESLIDFLNSLALYGDNGLGDEEFKLVYGALRFIHFIHQHEEDIQHVALV